MSISNYTELKAAISDWMARGDISGNAADMVTLAEARLNRLLKPVVTDIALTGTQDSRRIDISAHDVVETMALFLAETGATERELVRKVDGTFSYIDETGFPRFWAADENSKYIDFDYKLDQPYTFRLRARQRFALSDLAPTNWLLSNHPDTYLMASLVWGGAYIKDFPYAGAMKGALDEAISEVRNYIALQNRSILTVDSALANIGHRRLSRL
jgi:hypothetical protein